MNKGRELENTVNDNHLTVSRMVAAECVYNFATSSMLKTLIGVPHRALITSAIRQKEPLGKFATFSTSSWLMMNLVLVFHGT